MGKLAIQGNHLLHIGTYYRKPSISIGKIKELVTSKQVKPFPHNTRGGHQLALAVIGETAQ